MIVNVKLMPTFALSWREQPWVVRPVLSPWPGLKLTSATHHRISPFSSSPSFPLHKPRFILIVLNISDRAHPSRLFKLNVVEIAIPAFAPYLPTQRRRGFLLLPDSPRRKEARFSIFKGDTFIRELCQNFGASDAPSRRLAPANGAPPQIPPCSPRKRQ
jgi:hypothetical protein